MVHAALGDSLGVQGIEVVLVVVALVDENVVLEEVIAASNEDCRVAECGDAHARGLAANKLRDLAHIPPRKLQ